MVDLRDDLDGYTVTFTSLLEDIDATPLMQREPGTEFVSFSPSEELRTAEAVMMKNAKAMQEGSTP